MPLYRTIIHDTETKVFVWKITESFNNLSADLILTEKSKNRINSMKSDIHKLGFLAVRKLLATANYSDNDLYYDDFGKPHLIDNKHISISHSHQFATIIISDKTVGIDVEMQREKIIGIANKFINDEELSFLNPENQSEFIKKLTIIWGTKESIFKIINQQGISFKNHIFVKKFEIEDQKITAILETDFLKQKFFMNFKEIDNFIFVYVFCKLD